MLKSLITAVILALGLTAAANAQTAAYKIGDTIPQSLTFTDQSGKVHTFGEYRGHPLVLEWTNHGCPFVRKHYDSGNMQKLQADAVANGTAWVAVASSAPGKQGYIDPKDGATEVKNMGFKGTALALDPEGKLGKAFGAETSPHMFVISSAGKLVYRGAIDSIPSFDQDDIAKADNYVTKALAELAAGKPVSTPQTNPYGCSVKY
jgi:hypothetical protein